jgi:hypothetical protein
MIHFVVPRSRDFTIWDYLGSWGRALAGRITILHYEDLPTWRTVSTGAYVLTAIDQLYPPGRRLLGEFCDQLLRSGAGVRVLNSPRTTLLRFELLEELHRRGLNRHRAARAIDDLQGLRFPVFLHEEHQHTGALTPLLRTPAELEEGLAWAIVRGHVLKDLIVVEYCDTADAEGFFNKYSAFAVGSEIIPKSLERGRSWMLKRAGSEFTEPMLREEQAYVLENPHEHELRRIFEIAHVEYGRIDYSLKDGVIQTWEINLHPIVGPVSWSKPVPEQLRPLRSETEKHFYSRLQAAFEAIDVGNGEEGPRSISIRYSPENLRHLRPMTRPKAAKNRRALLRMALRPLRPLIHRIMRTVSPVLVKVFRRVR